MVLYEKRSISATIVEGYTISSPSIVVPEHAAETLARYEANELKQAEVQIKLEWLASKYVLDACWSVGSQARVVCRALPHVVEFVTPAGSDPSSRKSWKDALTMMNLASTGTRIAKGPIWSQGGTRLPASGCSCRRPQRVGGPVI